jgi:mucolipin
VFSDLEMSDLSSKVLVEENSCCESESETENREKINKYKSRKKRKEQTEMNRANSQQQRSFESSDDELESQQHVNYDVNPINSTPFSSPISIYNQDKMRRRLQFFFMNPIEKWQAKRR